MAGPFFVRTAASGGNNGNTGLAWDNAYATFAYAIGVAANGETIVLASDIDEAILAATVAGSTTKGNPKKFISATAQASGTSIVYAAGARLDRSGGGLAPTGEFCAYGISFIVEDTGNFYLAQNDNDGFKLYDGCTLRSQSAFLMIGNNNYTELRNCGLTCASSGTNNIIDNYASSGCTVVATGCTLTHSTGASDWGIVGTVADGQFYFSGCDVSAVTTITKTAVIGKQGRAIFRGCKLPASWSAGTFTNPYYDGHILVERSSSGTRSATAAGLSSFKTYKGEVAHSSVYRTEGATDGDNYYSWKFTGSQAYCRYSTPLVSPPITAWVDGDGSSKSVTIHFAIDAQSSDSQTNASTLTPAEIWFDILTPNETASPNTTYQDRYQTCRSDPEASASTHTTGDAWTGSAVGATYKYSFTIAPALPGPVIVRAYVATLKNEIYVCPKIGIA